MSEETGSEKQTIIDELLRKYPKLPLPGVTIRYDPLLDQHPFYLGVAASTFTTGESTTILVSSLGMGQSGDIRQLAVGSVFESSEAFLNLCRGQTSQCRLLSIDDVKDITSLHFPGKRICGAVEAAIPEDPHRYLFWLERVKGRLRIAGVERLTAARQASK